MLEWQPSFKSSNAVQVGEIRNVARLNSIAVHPYELDVRQLVSLCMHVPTL